MIRLSLVTLVLGTALLLASAPEAQLYGDYALDPKTYSSPSGEVQLFVDPSQASGAGPATYRCTRAQVELWSGKRPYTLCDAQITDDGLVAGYGYAAGYMGGEDDALVVVLLAPDGEARLEQRTPREGYLSDTGSPVPMVAGLFLDPENDRFVVRGRPGSFDPAESWLTYSLTTGQPGPRLNPRAGLPPEERVRWILAARALSGAPLVLVQWLWSDYMAGQHGAVFTLLDAEAKVVWRLDKPLDYMVEGDEKATNRLLAEMRDQGAILSVEAGRFTLRLAAENERATFEVEALTGARRGWDVREVARAPFNPDAPSAVSGTAEALKLDLKPLGSIQLGSPPQTSPIRDVLSFALDGAGRPGFLRRSEQRFEFVRVDGDGENPLEIPLPPPPEGEWWQYSLAWTAGERWILTASGGGEDGQHAWWLDAASRALTPIEGFKAPSVESLAGTPEGGFVVVGTTQYDGGYFTNDLVAFDRGGKRMFALGGDQGLPLRPESLFAPEAVAVLPSGQIVVLDNSRNALQFFSPAGEFLRFVDLEEAWGRKPNYLAGLRADLAGGLIVHDSSGQPPVVRLDEAGKILSGLDPHYSDGGAFYARGDVQVDPKGALWTSDGHALLVLNGEGAVERALGSAPDALELGEIGLLTVAPNGRIYAADERTAAVHVFDAAGRLAHVCKPDPGDFEGNLGRGRLTVTEAGEVLLGDVRFGADGARLERRERTAAAISGERYPQQGSELVWVIGHNALRLVDAAGQEVRSIQRTPDGNWLRGIDQSAVAPDGSLALATSGRFSNASPAIHLYAASGEPLRSFAAPEGMPSWLDFAFDGERFALAVVGKEQPGAVVLMDSQGVPLGRFTPGGDVALWQPFLVGKELWLFDGKRRIDRYALP